MNLQRAVVAEATVIPEGSLAVLSQSEVNDLCSLEVTDVYAKFRSCALAALTSGIETDSARELLEAYSDFDVSFRQSDRGLGLLLRNAPAHAFVDGRIIKGIRELLFAVVRDVLFVGRRGRTSTVHGMQDAEGVTDDVFERLRLADLLAMGPQRGLVVCWGGHSIGRVEYDYCKEVGYELGLRGLEICTGCGPGAMKGPMKGATIAHAKQRIANARYVGITEPGIIAAEAPNPIVSNLVIMPDIEKRLEAFVRLGHGVVVFPGGVGTVEEVLYLLGVLSHPANAELPFPLVLTGPLASAGYLQQIDAFIRRCFGDAFSRRYEIVVDDPVGVARRLRHGVDAVGRHREARDNAPYFNWSLRVDEAFQQPFAPTHEAMAGLELSRGMPVHELACNLRKAFSGLVCGNVKEEGIRAIETHGPYQLGGDPELMAALDDLLRGFADQGRMRLAGRPYTPCYQLRR